MSKGNADRMVYVGPERDEVILDAVENAGARTVSNPGEADVLVWLSPSVADLREALHAGVEWVQLKSAGVDHIIRSGLIDSQRLWTGARGAYAEAVAEHGLTLMLAAARRLHEILGQQSWGEPGSRFGRTIARSSVGIIGCGAIGESLIGLLAPFDVEVMAVTRSGRTVSGATESFRTEDADEVVQRADYLVLSAPATAETRGFIDRRRLELMPDHAWLVNIGRGDLVVTADLVAALHGGAIGGAALDVTDPEPLPDGHPLWSAPNTIITPHTSNPPEENSRTLAKRVGENLRRLAQGSELLGTIDPARGY